MSAQEVINEIQHLPPTERDQVTRFVFENDCSTNSSKCTEAVADDGLPVIRASGGVLTSRLVRELESLTP